MMKGGERVGSRKRYAQAKKREELKMTANIVDHSGDVKDNGEDEEGTYARNQPMSLSLIL